MDSTGGSAWLGALRSYLAATAGASLIWEAAHLPLYTLWTVGTPGERAFAILHCSAGDILIATSALVLALVLAGTRAWPRVGFRRVTALTVIFGLAYTAFSEWLNTAVRSTWAYSDLMPVVRFAGLEVGMSPLLQWIAVPALAFTCAWRRAARTARHEEDGS
jgi:hypothetical protein